MSVSLNNNIINVDIFKFIFNYSYIKYCYNELKKKTKWIYSWIYFK